jgi:nicotinamide-nucleotide amidase
MFEMWHASVAPTIASLRRTPGVLRHRVIKLFGPGESQLEAMLPEMIARERSPRVGITASQATLSLRITAQGPDEASCAAQIAETVDEIYRVAGKYVFGEGEEDLDYVLLQTLAGRRATLATSESYTGGQLACWFSALDPARDIYRGGSIRGELELLLPLEQARRVREEMNSTFGLAVGRETEHEIEVAWHDGTSDEVLAVKRGGHPAVEVARVAKSAINMLRLHLVGLD